jgi:HlyD family secretion protein
MKKVSILMILILFTITSLLAITGFGCKKPQNDPAKAKPLPPQKVKAERGPMKLVVASTGRVVSNLDVEIKCKASGEVISLPYDISDEVQKGSLVVELDPVDEERNVQKSRVSLEAVQSRYEKTKLDLEIAQINLESSRKKAEVNLETAKTRAEDARAKADREKAMYDKKLSSLEQLETAETTAQKAEADLTSATIALEDINTDEQSLKLKKEDLKISRTDVESAKINLSIAEQRLVETKVFAPIDGIITERLVQTGQIISSGISNTGGGTKVMTISDLSRLFVLASVDESDIGEVRKDMNVEITADAYQDKKFNGKIDRIAQKGLNQSNVVTFEVRIEILSENKSLLKPEMTANVDIIAVSKDDVVSVPIGAVSREKGKQFVTVVKDDGTEEKREIQAGINDGEKIEIISGISEGETVLVKMNGGSQWSRENGPPGGAANPVRMMGVRPGGR